MTGTPRPPTPPGVAAYELGGAERRRIASAMHDLRSRYGSAESAEFLAAARRLAYTTLPEGVVAFFESTFRTESAAAALLAGVPVDDRAIGATPLDWRSPQGREAAIGHELLFVLLGSVLGEVFGWTTLQDGHLIHEVVPVRHEEFEQSGHGSSATLAWHTEDGFHPYRCDYLGLMGLRNHEGVPTTFASVDCLDLTGEQRRVLSEPRFVIRPDDEHLYQRLRHPASEPRAPAATQEFWLHPAPTSVLFGAADHPYLRVDPPFMSPLPGDAQAAAALEAVVRQLDAGLVDLVIGSGMVCFIDNYRAVHGRKAFKARYDGTDRWLKKLLVTRDLRKSRAARRGPDARQVAPTVPAGGGLVGAASARHPQGAAP